MLSSGFYLAIKNRFPCSLHDEHDLVTGTLRFLFSLRRLEEL